MSTNEQSLSRSRVEAATAANIEDTGQAPDITYQREWKYYTRFIDAEREASRIPMGSKYLTRDSVDLYFSHVIAHRIEVQPVTARKARPALQWYANHREYPIENFQVDSAAVQRALEAQERRYMQRVAELELEDPHANLPTDVLNDEDHQKILNHVFSTNAANWKDMSVSWTTCTSTYVRCASARAFHLPDLRLDKSHGPEKSGFARNVLSFILRKGRHKTHKTSKKVTGAWRHRNYLQCCTGMVAASLMIRLYYRRDIDFYNSTNSWKKVKLLEGWSSEGSASTAYEEVLTATNTSWGKVTHLRKTGTEQSSATGDLGPMEQATMWKHKTDKVFQYSTELFAPVMHVMAGFRRKDAYHVPRIKIELPEHWGNVTSIIFPQWNVWKAQATSATNGDKTDAADNFLNELLPFLARVVVQDGIFWIRDFKHHAIARHLLHVMPPDYERWAKEQREWIAQQAKEFEVNKIQQLNKSVQASFNQMKAEVHACWSEVKSLREENREQKQAINSLHEKMDFLTSLLTGKTGELRVTLPTQVAARPQQQTAVITAAPPRRMVTSVLRNTPAKPAIPKNLPELMTTLLHEHEVLYKLTDFEHPSTRKDWESALKIAFSRRTYLYNELIARANRQRNNMDMDGRKKLAAKNMDLEMKSNSLANVSTYLKFLKARDPNQKKRKRTTTVHVI